MDFERQERDLRREMAAERAQEVRDEQRRIGAYRGDQVDLVPVVWIPDGFTYHHACALCDSILQTFDLPVPRETLKSKLCDHCLAWKQRKLTYQRLALKHPEWRKHD